jgi:hypothetical protein
MRRDDGAAIVMVAISMVAMIGVVGLVIDLGIVYEERRELSRGADAAVLAIAADCATQAKSCDDGTAWDTANQYADENADDGAAGISGLDLDVPNRTVWAQTNSVNAATGAGTVDLAFLRVLGFNSTRVEAEATAIWGYPRGGGALPLIISDCEYFKYVDPVEGPNEDLVVTLFFHQGVEIDGCNAQAGLDFDEDGLLAGGFGWLNSSGCEAYVAIGAWTGADPGSSPSTGCRPDELRNLLLDQTVTLPYFKDTDGIEGLGATGRYLVDGLGAFHVTGYNFGGLFKESISGGIPCFGDARCIRGFFSTKVIDDGSTGGPNRGVAIVRLVA